MDDVCNVLVTLPSGQRFALNVWTYEFFERTRRDGEGLASHHLQQSYMLPPDLFVVDLDPTTLEAVVNDLLERGLMPKHCIVEEEN